MGDYCERCKFPVNLDEWHYCAYCGRRLRGEEQPDVRGRQGWTWNAKIASGVLVIGLGVAGVFWVIMRMR